MEGNIRLGCPWCDTNIIVMPPDLYEALGEWGGLEAQVEFSQVVHGSLTPGGDRLAVSDPRRQVTCPVCGRGIQLPPAGSTDPPARVEPGG